ncbi:MAG: DNA-binding protein WhiA [Lachnospiraceae bacterium]|nr:DNA-binding protein WhiA [Lachnospiraceae bacterium]
MSFSGEVKKELCEQISPARHCKLAEISAIIAFCGKLVVDKDQTLILKLQTESTILTKKIFLLLKQVFRVSAELTTKSVSAKKNLYELTLSAEETSLVLEACKLTVGEEEKSGCLLVAEPTIVTKSCCKRSFIRGAFLAAGSVSNPNKAYHFEIVVGQKQNGELLCEVMRSFDIDAKMIARKYHYVVYVKEGSQIVDLLNIMEAHVALMEFENVRILKDMRNTINRKVNCEAANINKTVKAATRQVEDILYIRDKIGLAALAEGLEEIALLRIEYPEASLKELGEMLHPPVGKSGVNHRLKKLSEIAEGLRTRSI